MKDRHRREKQNSGTVSQEQVGIIGNPACVYVNVYVYAYVCIPVCMPMYFLT